MGLRSGSHCAIIVPWRLMSAGDLITEPVPFALLNEHDGVGCPCSSGVGQEREGVRSLSQLKTHSAESQAIWVRR